MKESSHRGLSVLSQLLERNHDVGADPDALPVVTGLGLQGLAERVGTLLAGLQDAEVGVEADVRLDLLAVADDTGTEVLPVGTRQDGAGRVARGPVRQRDGSRDGAGVLDPEHLVDVLAGSEVVELQLQLTGVAVRRRSELERQRCRLARHLEVVRRREVRTGHAGSEHHQADQRRPGEANDGRLDAVLLRGHRRPLPATLWLHLAPYRAYGPPEHFCTGT